MMKMKWLIAGAAAGLMMWGIMQVWAQGGTATITGKVLFKGTPPKLRKLPVHTKPECKKLHKTPPLEETVVVNPNKTLRWVFVYVKEKPKGNWKPPSKPVVIDQKGCIYIPHVFGIMVGQTLNIVNTDGFNHNINCQGKRPGNSFNITQPRKMTDKRTLKSKEIMVPFKCNVHRWMTAYAGVLDHPFFAVSDANGAFTIKGLPPGEYTLEAWHEKYKRKTQKVKVEAGKTVQVTFTYP